MSDGASVMHMNFCPRCGRRLALTRLERKERPCCLESEGGCGFVDYGRYTMGVGGVIVSHDDGERRILLIQRNQEPNRGGWTLPGGFVEYDEPAEVSVVREIAEETGLHCEVIGLLGFRSRVDNDTNTSYAIFGLRVLGGELVATPTDEIAAVKFFSLSALDALTRLAPLSRAVAVMALTREPALWQATTIPSPIANRPSFNLFMG
jgi:ADP-ribose pyrophosphatase YjhB (NUDIX family)